MSHGQIVSTYSGNWTTRGYANSRTGHFADWTTRGLPDAAKRTKSKHAKSPMGITDFWARKVPIPPMASASCPVTLIATLVVDADIIFLPCDIYLLSFFIPRLISAVVGWMFTTLRHTMWP